jgi:hypothetical protein
LTDLKWPKSYFRCRICGGEPWQKSDSKPVVITFRTSPSIALQMSALKIIGRCVLSAGAADANTAARAALYVQGVLRRDYNLMTD